MTPSEIGITRLYNQQLYSTRFTNGADLVAWFAAVQGQEYGPTKWGVAMRLPGLTDADIETELVDGTILRTHLLRPTWHFVSYQDIRWILTLSAPRVHAANAFMYRQLELDSSIFKRSHKIITKVLEGGNELTRDEINEAFKKQKITATGHRLSYIMMHAELEGLICSGSRRGNQFTYALLDERVRPISSVTVEEGLAELTRRYYSSRGPATVHDFATWSGLTITQCRKGIASNVDLLAVDQCDGKEYVSMRGSVGDYKALKGKLLLLPVYDELFLGYKDRSVFFRFRESMGSSAKLRYDSMILFDGQVIGTWKRVIKTKHVDLFCCFFAPLTSAQTRAFQIEVNRFQSFNGMDVNVIVE